MSEVVWHDVECGAYVADLPLWRDLAVSPVLDVGAGTGRVALDLARRGHDVTALDRDGALLAALEHRASGRVRTVCADAEAFDLGRSFATILVPMQTVQLLGDRPAFLRCARAHLVPGGLLAMALADALEPFEGPLPVPDARGRFVSQPTAIRIAGGVARLERLRDDGENVTTNVVELHQLTPDQLAAEAAAAGFEPGDPVRIPPTDEHVGSTVVIARG